MSSLTRSLLRVLHKYSRDCIATADPWALMTQSLHTKRPNERVRSVKCFGRLEEREVDQLVHRYAELQSLRLLAVEFSLDRTTARQHLKRRGVRLREVHRMSKTEVARAVEIYGLFAVEGVGR